MVAQNYPRPKPVPPPGRLLKEGDAFNRLMFEEAQLNQHIKHRLDLLNELTPTFGPEQYDPIGVSEFYEDKYHGGVVVGRVRVIHFYGYGFRGFVYPDKAMISDDDFFHYRCIPGEYQDNCGKCWNISNKTFFEQLLDILK